ALLAFAISVHAKSPVKGEHAVIANNFDCSSEVATLQLMETDGLVSCIVVADVKDPQTKRVLIPRGSRLAGEKSQGHVHWIRWVTPDGLTVSDAQSKSPLLISAIKRPITDEDRYSYQVFSVKVLPAVPVATESK
ncbi:hypothetical protein PQR05_38145, partial [Paraburkholderia sediminicola]